MNKISLLIGFTILISASCNNRNNSSKQLNAPVASPSSDTTLINLNEIKNTLSQLPKFSNSGFAFFDYPLSEINDSAIFRRKDFSTQEFSPLCDSTFTEVFPRDVEPITDEISANVPLKWLRVLVKQPKLKESLSENDIVQIKIKKLYLFYIVTEPSFFSSEKFDSNSFFTWSMTAQCYDKVEKKASSGEDLEIESDSYTKRYRAFMLANVLTADEVYLIENQTETKLTPPDTIYALGYSEIFAINRFLAYVPHFNNVAKIDATKMTVNDFNNILSSEH